jgi:signal transduction histidine kinase
MLGVPLWLSASAFLCAILPPLVGMFVQGSATAPRVAELETVLWIAVATMATTSTGGLSSAILVLFAVPVATAWSSGRARLTAEVAVFALLGLAVAGILGAGGSWLAPRDADILATVFGVASVALVGAIAAVEASRRPPARAVEAPAPATRSTADAENSLRIRQLETRARAAREEAETAKAKLEARTTFFAQTSHELRTPLNAILGFAEMMRNAVFGPLPDKYQEYAGLIHEGGRNLSLIVDDVLDLARLEAGRYEIYRDLVSLTDLAAEAVHFMRDEAVRRGIAMELDDGEDVEAFADSKAVRQIALNLVSNALKFTPAGGAVTVAALDAPGGALLAVSDTGAGISPEELTRLSRAFEQGEAGKRQKGAGLGLSVVRAFAELHGGRLDIESRQGGGSTIAVFFPSGTASGTDGDA